MRAWPFFFSVVACGTILIAIYNNYFPWNRIYQDAARGSNKLYLRSPCLSYQFSIPTPPDKLSADQFKEWNEAIEKERKKICDDVHDVRLEGIKQDVRHLSDNNAIALPWLGITLGSADLDIFGSMGVFIASMYYWLCVRRVTRDIGQLLTSAVDLSQEDRTYVYFGIRQSLVLNFETDLSSPSTVARGLKAVLSLLTYLPATVILCLLFGDLWYLLTLTYPGGLLLWWQSLGTEFKVQFVTGDVVAFLVGLPILFLNNSILGLQRDLSHFMTKFGTSV